MKGSAKQIEWANTIKAEKQSTIDALIGHDIVSALNNHGDASFWITYRNESVPRMAERLKQREIDAIISDMEDSGEPDPVVDEKEAELYESLRQEMSQVNGDYHEIMRKMSQNFQKSL